MRHDPNLDALRARNAGVALATALACLAAVTCSAPGGSPPAGEPETGPSVAQPAIELLGHRFEHRRLANGLEALAVHEPGAETVSVYVAFAVGTRMEAPETAGLAHLTEHALFSGTPTTGDGEHERIVRELGGQANAYTRADYTLYYDDDLPPEQLDRVLAMEADRMRGLAFDESAVLGERARLEDEERRSASEAVRREALVDRAVFGERSYGASVPDRNGRTKAPDLDVATVRDFYDRWYHPRNAAVVVAGAIDPTVALDRIEAAFGGIPRGPEAPSPADLPTPTGKELQLESDLAAPRLVHAWRGPPRRSDDGSVSDRVALEALAFKLERRHEGLTASAGYRAGPDRFTLSAAGENAASVLDRALAEAREGTLDEAELARATAALEQEIQATPLRGRPYFSLAGQLAVLGALGDPHYPKDRQDALRTLTPEDVHAAATRWLAPESRVAVRFVPDASARGETLAELPDDPKAIVAFAERARDSGDLAGAVKAYRHLGERTKSDQTRVIALYQVGSLERQRGRYPEAAAALEEALAIVDYPAVRSLLEEVEAELRDGGARAPVERAAAPPVERAASPHAGGSAASHGQSAGHGASHGSGHGIANPESLDPAIVRDAEEWMARLEAWRGLPFLEDLHLEYGVPGTEDEKLAGFYSPDEKRLVVMAGRSETFTRGTLLHEILHALQDQHFDLARLHREAKSADAEQALASLIEGEAMLAVAELMNYDFLAHADPFRESPVDRARFQKVFRYAEGMRMVRALRDAGGWALVDEAWRSPPDRTAQVLKPELWIERDRSADASRDAEADGLGAYGVYLFLGERESSRGEARDVAALLVDDRFESAPSAADGEGHRWTLEFRDADTAQRFRRLADGREGVTLADASDGDARVVLELARGVDP